MMIDMTIVGGLALFPYRRPFGPHSLRHGSGDMAGFTDDDATTGHWNATSSNDAGFRRSEG